MIAKLIGERSAGMTVVEIYDGDNLVWSHMYFADGATRREYINGLCQAYDDMVGAGDVGQYEGCDYDEDGEVIQYSDDETSGTILEYDSETGTWTVGDRYGQSDEILDALMLIGAIPADYMHADRIEDAVVNAIMHHVRNI